MHRPRPIAAVVGAALLGATVAGPVIAAPGDLDPTFGGTGIVRDAMSGNGAQATGVAIDSAGRIVVGGSVAVSGVNGDFGVLRLLADGTPDTAFGTNGRAVHSFSAASDEEAYGLVVQPDDRPVIAGVSFLIGPFNDFAALRLNADGSPDASFGNHGNGWFKSGLDGTDVGLALARGADGGFLLGGYVDTGGNQLAAAGLRLDGVGMAVPGFGTAGLVLGADDTNSARAAAMQADGRSLLGAALDESGGGIVLRFNADGSADGGFSGDGRAEIPALIRIEDMIVLADGRIVACGDTPTGDAGVVRLLADGSLDTGFGSNGVAVLTAASLGAPGLFTRALAVQADGGLVVAGMVNTFAEDPMLAFRLDGSGQPDPGFGAGGVRVLTGHGDMIAEAVAIQPDGAIVLAGRDFTGPEDQFVIVRLEGGGGGGEPPPRTLSVADSTLVEGDSGNTLMSFTVTLSTPSGGGVGVTAQTDLGSAEPNVDYVPTGAFLTFDEGVSSVVFQVPVIGDTVPEPNETFLVRLSDAANAAIGDGVATGTIIDDDAGVPNPPAQPVPVLAPAALALLAAMLALLAWHARRRV